MLVSNQGAGRGGTLGWVHITQDLKFQPCFWQFFPCHWYPVCKYVISNMTPPRGIFKTSSLLTNFITGKSQTEAKMYKSIDWAIARSIHQGRGLRFFCNDQTNKMGLISYLFYGLFIMHLSQHKTNNWPADNFKNELYTWAHDTVRWHWSADAIFDSYQLSITWISIRMATTCLGHLVNNTWSLQENSQ